MKVQTRLDRRALRPLPKVVELAGVAWLHLEHKPVRWGRADRDEHRLPGSQSPKHERPVSVLLKPARRCAGGHEHASHVGVDDGRPGDANGGDLYKQRTTVWPALRCAVISIPPSASNDAKVASG